MDDRRLLLFFAISLAILVIWYALVPAPPPPVAAPPLAEEGPVIGEPVRPAPRAPEPPEEEEPEATPELSPIASASEERLVLETDQYQVELTNRGGQMLSFVVKGQQDDEGRPLELVRRRTEGPWPLALMGEDLSPLPVNDALFVAQQRRDGEARVLDFEYRGPEGNARKVVRLLPSGLLELEIEVRGEPGWGLFLGPGIREADPGSQRGTMGFGGPAAIYSRLGEVESERPGKMRQVQVLPGAGVTWAGLEDIYFLSAVVLGTPLQAMVLQPVVVVDRGEGMPVEHVPFRSEDELAPEHRRMPRDVQVVLQASGETLRASAYFGPKEYERLRSFEMGLERSVQWGWFGFLVLPLLKGLVWIHGNVVANFGWAIVLMTIGLKIVLFPLTHKSIVSMQKMQVLQPKIQAIRQKFKGKLRDKRGRMDMEAQRKMNEEMQALFRAEGASPTGGCLPMLLQIPVFFAFFRLLITTVELRQEPWMLWIQDVSVPDPWYILPVAMGLTQVYQQKLTPMSADPMQRRIMQFFPWMFMIFAFSFPSGVVLYWTVNNVLTIFQTKAYKSLDSKRKARAEEKRPVEKGERKVETKRERPDEKGSSPRRGEEKRARRTKRS